MSPTVTPSKGTTPSVSPTASASRSTSRFRPTFKSFRTTSRTARPQTSKATTLASKRLSTLRNRKKTLLSPNKPFDLDVSPTRNRFDGSRLSRLSLRPSTKENSVIQVTTRRSSLNIPEELDNVATQHKTEQQETTEKTVGDIVAGLHGDTTDAPEEFVLVRKFKPKFGSNTRDKLRKRLRDQLAQEDNNSTKSAEQLDNITVQDVNNVHQQQGKLQTLAPKPKIQAKTRVRSRNGGLTSNKLRTRKRPTPSGVSNKVSRPKPRTRTRNRQNNIRRPVGAPRGSIKNNAEEVRDNSI